MVAFVFVLAFLTTSPLATDDLRRCDCVFVNSTTMPMTEYRLKVYDAVFIGHVIKVELLDEATWGDWTMRERSTEFQVMKHWKGPSQDRIVIKAAGSNCAYPFKLGESYLVFAYEADEQERQDELMLTADVCDPEGTGLLLESAEQIQKLEAVVKRKQDQDGDSGN